jgi:chitinase
MSSLRRRHGRVELELWLLALYAAATFSVISAQVTTLDRTRYPCPRSCTQNLDQSGWSSFYQLDRLNECDEPMLVTVSTFTPVDDSGRQLKIRACTTGNADTAFNALTGTSAILTTGNSSMSVSNSAGAQPPTQDVGRIARRNDLDDSDVEPPVCRGASNTNATAQWLSWRSGSGSGTGANIVASLKDSQKFLEDKVNCEETVIYGSFKGSLVGIYVGNGLQNDGIATGFVQDVIDRLSTSNSTEHVARTVAQVCGAGRNSDNHVGVVTDPKGDLAWVQRAVRSWAEARCVNESSSENFETVKSYAANIASNLGNSTKARRASLEGQCHQVQAVHGDTLQSMASKCSISINKIRSLNHLPAGWKPHPHQWVCCTSGGFSRRDAPKPRPDGTCASYVIKNDDNCDKIKTEYGITTQDIYDYNKETWAWAGCDGILPGQRICVGPGTPRLPPPNPDAECGPSKPGTSWLSGKIGDLSPCPIKACCNVWGNCGVDRDFCVPTTSETGNPGSAAPNTNGCVQNCGMDIVKSGPAPASFMKVGYFEAFNGERSCLHMSPKQIPSGFTHVHYAFVDISPGFGVSLGQYADVFEEFKTLKGPKRIIAFGGWAFSTEPATYLFFRNAVKPENRNTFADACVAFVTSHGLDGVDFDWEYPAEPDIPGIPAGDPEESLNYLEFVKVVKSKMPAGKTVSIAAPASYWYLKQFLIEDMAKVVDYIIYM